MSETKQTEQKEIGRVKLNDTQDLVASIVDNEKLDLRVFVKTDSYTGTTKRWVRFYLFDNKRKAVLKGKNSIELKGCKT